MPVGEYLIIFSAILIGLAVADLSLSLHRMMRQGRDIRWHPIVPIAGFIVLCLILNLWWGLYRAFSQTTEIYFVEFLPQVFMLLALFLMAAAVFPDEKLPKGASLKDFYLDNRTQFWGLVAVYLVMVIINVGQNGVQQGWDVWTHLERARDNLIGVGCCLVVMRTRRMIFHWAMIAISLFAISVGWFGARLAPVAVG